MRGPATVVGAFVRRDWDIARSYRLPFVLEGLSALFMLVLFHSIARIVDPNAVDAGGSARAELADGYFAFVIIGLVLLGLFQTGLTAAAERLSAEQSTGTFEVLLATPARPWVLIAGSSAYSLVRETVLGVLTLAVAALAFGLRLDAGPADLLVALAAVAGCVLLFGATGILVAAFGVVFKQVGPVVAPLTMFVGIFAGVYVPTDVLPAPLADAAAWFPLTWGVDALRAALLGLELDEARLLGLLVLGALSLPLSLAVFDRALERARRTGTLALY